jgi:hypothetical protein
MVIKYINILQSKALQNLPKLGFLVIKETIWQPCVALNLLPARPVSCPWHKTVMIGGLLSDRFQVLNFETVRTFRSDFASSEVIKSI